MACCLTGSQTVHPWHAQSSQAGAASTDAQLKLLKALRLFRLAKLLRLARIRTLVKRWEDLIAPGIMFSIQLSTLFFAVLFAAHLICCAWYMVGTYGTPELGDGLNATSSGESSVLSESDTTETIQVGWMHRLVDGKRDFNEQTLWYRYLRTYYWSVGLTSGSARGDIAPTATSEFLFVIMMEVVGTVALGLLLGSLSSMFTTSRLLEDRVERQLAELREFLTEKRVPKKLKNRVRHYMELLYRHKTGYDEQGLLMALPPR
jgi:hypothetical protein